MVRRWKVASIAARLCIRRNP